MAFKVGLFTAQFISSGIGVFLALSLLIQTNIAVAQWPEADNPSEQSKLALVVGNSAYPDSLALANPVHDAEDIAASLRRLGFEVILLANADQAQMQAGLQQFDAGIKNKQVAVFYYAGHGVQVGGENYLVPVDSQINSAKDIQNSALNIHRVLQTMEQAHTPMNIVILDACRDNPFRGMDSFDVAGMRALPSSLSPEPETVSRSTTVQQSTPGLNQAADGPAGYLIAFATSPGKTTSDGKNRNGLYTQFLLRHLETPHISIEEMFKRVLNDVRDETHGRQTPWISSAFKGDFCFADCRARVKSVQQPPQPEQEDVLPTVGLGF